jgi:hypothetical protein
VVSGCDNGLIAILKCDKTGLARIVARTHNGIITSMAIHAGGREGTGVVLLEAMNRWNRSITVGLLVSCTQVSKQML